jgi:hypothetical protein
MSIPILIRKKMCPLCSAHGDNYTSPWRGKGVSHKGLRFEVKIGSTRMDGGWGIRRIKKRPASGAPV